jgi:hypothetical protein
VETSRHDGGRGVPRPSLAPIADPRAVSPGIDYANGRIDFADVVELSSIL